MLEPFGVRYEVIPICDTQVAREKCLFQLPGRTWHTIAGRGCGKDGNIEEVYVRERESERERERERERGREREDRKSVV